MSKAFRELKRQRHRDASSERDAIRSANKAKGFIYGRDSVSSNDESVSIPNRD